MNDFMFLRNSYTPTIIRKQYRKKFYLYQKMYHIRIKNEMTSKNAVKLSCLLDDERYIWFLVSNIEDIAFSILKLWENLFPVAFVRFDFMH